MVQICIDERYYPFPESWNELTFKQLKAIAPILLSKEIQLKHIVRLFRILLPCSWYRWKRIPGHEIMDHLDRVNFLIEEKIMLTKQRLPKYRKCYGPASEFMNLKAKEATFAEAWWAQYNFENDVDAKNIDALNHLAAILYRPKKRWYNVKRNREGDPRIEFSSSEIDYRVAKVKKWPLEVKQVIFLWFTGCQNMLIENNPKVFSGGDNPSLHGMWSVMRSIAVGGAHGDFSRVENMYYPELLMEINETIQEAENLKKQVKK